MTIAAVRFTGLDNGQPAHRGTLAWDGSHWYHSEGHNWLTQLLEESAPVYGEPTPRTVKARENPGLFLRNLQHKYQSLYHWASEPFEHDGKVEELIPIKDWSSFTAEPSNQGEAVRQRIHHENAAKRAEQADLIHIPDNLPGTLCSNCSWYQRKDDTQGYCAHEKVDQPVEARQCCKFWDNPEVVRPWEVGKQGKKSLDTIDRDKLRALGEELSHDERAMPGYGQIYIDPLKGHLWYVGGDGDEQGFERDVKERLSKLPGISRVIYESEGFPKEDGWVKVYPLDGDKKTMSAYNSTSGGALVPPPQVGDSCCEDCKQGKKCKCKKGIEEGVDPDEEPNPVRPMRPVRKTKDLLPRSRFAPVPKPPRKGH